MINIKNKKIAVLGLGVENTPLIPFLVKNGANKIAVLDKNLFISKEDFGSVSEWQLGPQYLNNLNNFDIIFRSPGIPYFNPKVQEAKKKGVEITSVTKLFFDECKAKIIGITGTKGKGTTAALISEILTGKFQISNSKLQINSKSQIPKIYLAGNYGTSAIEVLDKAKENDWVILELSSFQLQDAIKSPNIAVVLNITQDHLDYHENKEEYVSAKQNIVAHQKKDDFALINADYLTSFEFGAITKAKVKWFSTRKSIDDGCFIKNDNIVLRIDSKDQIICPTQHVKLKGKHNLENICAAALTSYIAGASIEDIKKTLFSFAGLPHRLEEIAEINGVKYINDSYSTTPETAIAAMKSFTNPIILIIGGKSKGGNYEQLIGEIKINNIKKVILIGELTETLKLQIKEKGSRINTINLKKAKMSEIVKTAKTEAKEGDVVLFSPAAASFDMFKNATDRGNQFKKEVLKIKG